MLDLLDYSELPDRNRFLTKYVKTRLVATIFHLILAIFGVLGQEEAWMSVFELSAEACVSDGRRICSSMLIDILYGDLVTIRHLALLHVLIQYLLLEIF